MSFLSSGSVSSLEISTDAQN